MPKSNVKFWRTKFENTIARDLRTRRELENDGWRVCIVWECETKDPERMERWLRKTFNIGMEDSKSVV
jgi:DNA mismatch endonuclease (patch repair protein)